MSALLSSFTALPNLHPAVVHFPIALAFAALAVELVSLALPKRSWLGASAATLYGLAAAGAVTAFLAGREAAENIGVIAAQAEVILANHADLALWTMLLLCFAAALRITSCMMQSKPSVARFGALRTVALLALLASVVLVSRTADLGGALVYRHGVAVARAELHSTPLTSTPVILSDSPDARLVRSPGGGLDWNPFKGPGDDSPAAQRIGCWNLCGHG